MAPPIFTQFLSAFFSIPWKTTEEELKQHFSKFGNIVFANIKKDPETGNSRGFGFIRFENYESQKKAMEEATHEIDGRAVVLRLTKKVLTLSPDPFIIYLSF